MPLTDLQNSLAGTGIDDVLLTGNIDGTDGSQQFSPSYYSFFFECGPVLVRFRAVKYTGRMRIERVDAVVDEDLDGDLQPAWTSVGLAVLDDSIGENRLRMLRLWGVGVTAAGVECDAAQFDLANGQTIFLDPTYIFGIRVGGARQHAIWLENSVQKEYECVQLDLSGGAGPTR